MNVLVEKTGPVTTVILNRPERRNAVNEQTAAELLEAFEDENIIFIIIIFID